MKGFVLLGIVSLSAASVAQTPWLGFCGDSMHTGQSIVASRMLDKVIWSKPVEQTPGTTQYYSHFGSPCISASNTVLVPVKTQATDGFKVIAYDGTTGTRRWSTQSSYSVPPFAFATPFFGPTLLPPAPGSLDSRAAWPESGGRISIRASVDDAVSTKSVVAFYGLKNYKAAPSTYDNNVRISTPLTAGSDGSIYFGVVVSGSTPLNLESGLVRVKPDGTCLFARGSDLSGDVNIGRMRMNGAPAVTSSGQTLYVVTSSSTDSGGLGKLVRVNTATMQAINRVDILDPVWGTPASIQSYGSESPLIGPDGDVYVGSGFFQSNLEGWMMHYSGDLSQTKIPGNFGWDTTPSIVPASSFPSYTGSSPYLLFTKYNSYGDNEHRIALIDPNDTGIDPESGGVCMKVIASHLSPTFIPDTATRDEWCINAGVVDLPGKCILANNSNGRVYRWDLLTNTLSESIRITPPLAQVYTTTLIGPDGKVYAIHSGKLYAIGRDARHMIGR